MNKQEYYNLLSGLRKKVFGYPQAKKLLRMFEEESTNDTDFYNMFCDWLDKSKISSTLYLRDTLAERFSNRFNEVDFFNAWSHLDTFIIQVRENR